MLVKISKVIANAKDWKTKFGDLPVSIYEIQEALFEKKLLVFASFISCQTLSFLPNHYLHKNFPSFLSERRYF